MIYSVPKLTQVEELHLSKNDFSGGLPDIFGGLGNLKKLTLEKCKLSSLPER